MKKELGTCTAGERDDGDAAAAAADDDGGGGGGDDDGGEEAAGPARKKKKCTHGPDEPNCNKFSWTCLHKGEFELVLFQDSQLILHYSNFFCSERCGFISRGSKFLTASHKVWAPEGLWHYGVEGRSATDGDDQQQKKVAMAERRIVRNGTKGILWGLDRAFTNGHIMESFVAPADTPPHRRNAVLNKVDFCDRWASDVFATTKPLRRRWPAGLAVQLSQLSNGDLLNAASAHEAAQTEHECIDMAEVAAALNVSNPIHGKKHRVKYGKCRYDGCTITTSRGRAKYRCGACGDGKGWFYHLPCFMATHRITKK